MTKGFQKSLGCRGGGGFTGTVSNGSGYQLVRLKNGVFSVHSVAERETFHPVIGPAAEAEALYVRQQRLTERLDRESGEFVVWDVGLGAAANALTVLRLTRGHGQRIRLISFDHTLAPLEFARQHSLELGYVAGFEAPVETLLQQHRVEFTDAGRAIAWELHLGDFPTWLTQAAAAPQRPVPAPHAILFDAFSPAKNPAMWTLSLFANLFRLLDPQRPCVLPTYSRSTLLRVTLLLAGFYVGAGHATGEKEETTLAANQRELIDEPLDHNWLGRVQRSRSAEPLHGPVYQQTPITPESWARLQAHPQFA